MGNVNPPNCVLEYPHYLPDQVKPGLPAAQIKPAAKLITSCIEYGNAGRMITAQYLGDEAEEQAAVKEDKSQCQPAAPLKSSSSAEVPRRPLAFDTDLFFPSDAEHPEQTMLALAASDPIAVDGNSYASTLDYRLMPAPNSREAVPKLVQMRIVLRGDAERLTRSLLKLRREGTRADAGRRQCASSAGTRRGPVAAGSGGAAIF